MGCLNIQLVKFCLLFILELLSSTVPMVSLQLPLLYFLHVIHVQSSFRVREGSAEWVRI